MKTKNMYLNRLLRLGRHLGQKHLTQVLYENPKSYSSGKAGCAVEHFDWALAELPRLEPRKWCNDKGQPCLLTHERLSALTGAAVFFNLTGDELFHLFVPGYQDPIYKGIPLGENATPSDLAHNIYEFIATKSLQDSEQSTLTRLKKIKNKKVIKKFKLKNAA
ncbi:MAG: hypothetical protein WBM13_11205 [Bacteroidia bacterium]